MTWPELLVKTGRGAGEVALGSQGGTERSDVHQGPHNPSPAAGAGLLATLTDALRRLCGTRSGAMIVDTHRRLSYFTASRGVALDLPRGPYCSRHRFQRKKT